MKKILLSFSVIMLFITAFGQENPCPTVSGVRKTNVVNNGNGTCSGTITMHITNDVSTNPKGVQVEVFCGSSTTSVVNQCFLASTAPGGADYTTNSFTCSCSDPLTIRITRYTASNGSCQGGTCGQVIIIQQGPLPVSFTFFTAIRNHSVVTLKWETAFEQNNSGFEVQRMTGNGEWQTLATITSQGINGNSQSPLAYLYSDINNARGISQYRIKHVDLDGKSKYTEIRAVRGEGQIGKTIIYPNPTTVGKVNVVFEDATVIRDVSLIDMTGRVLQQWKGVTNNNIQIDNLTPGMYSLRIVVPETGERTLEKIVVNKR